jgi:hypothetical protein
MTDMTTQTPENILTLLGWHETQSSTVAFRQYRIAKNETTAEWRRIPVNNYLLTMCRDGSVWGDYITINLGMKDREMVVAKW